MYFKMHDVQACVQESMAKSNLNISHSRETTLIKKAFVVVCYELHTLQMHQFFQLL